MRWKWIAGTFFFLIFALMAAIYVFLYTFDYNRLKPHIARIVKDATGRELNIGGEIDLEIGLSPTLVATDITFANAAWGSQKQMIKVDKLLARVRLLPLLTRHVELRRIAIAGVAVLLETGPDGRGNWEFSVDERPAKIDGAFRAADISAGKIRFENLRLTFRDDKTGLVRRFTLIDLKVVRQAAGDADGLAVDLRADYNGRPLTLSGRTGVLREIFKAARFPLELSGAYSDVAISLKGTLDDVLHLKGIDLKVQTSGKNLAELKLTRDLRLPETNAFNLTGRLRGSNESLALSELSGNLAGSDVNLAFSGNVADLIAINGIDLQIKGSGKNLAKISALADRQLPATDEFAIQCRLTGSLKDLSLHKVNGSAKRGSLNLILNGDIKDLLAFSGMDLKLKGSGRNLTEVGAIIDRKLPATEEFALEGRLTGSTEVLTLMDAKATARSGGLQLALNGGVKNLIDLSGMDLQSRLTGSDLAEAGKIIEANLPATDQFEIQGRLVGSVRNLSLRQAGGQARRGSLSLALKGEIKNLLELGGMDLYLQGSGKNLAEIEALTGKKLPPTDEFSLECRLTGSGKALSLHDIRGRASRGGLSLEVAGAIKDLIAFTGMDLRLKAGGKELSEIGSLVGTTLPELGRFDFSGHLSGSARSFSMGDLKAVIDQSDFNGRAKVEVRRRPKITLVLESSLLDMTALMNALQQDEKGPGPVSGGPEERLFSTNPLPIDVLKQVDADISLKAKNVRARDANFEFGHLILTLENGDLDVDTLQANYKQTSISGNFHIYPESPPRVAAKFLVQDFDLGGLLKELGISEEVRSHLDIAVDVDSRGASPHDLMAALNGSVGAVMGEGYLTRYLDLLSVGLSRKVIHFWGSHKKGGEIRCAVVQFDVSNGIATSRAFVFDTEAGVLTGEGDINLGSEQVNFLLVPKPRYPSLMNFWTKLRVKGTIMNPKVRPDTLSLLSKGAKALSALVVGPLGLLAPFVNLGADHKHPCSVHSIGK